MSNDGFRSAMAKAGLSYAGAIRADGKLHRFKTQGDRAKNCWYVLYPGPPQAGAFGCWKRSINEDWCEKGRQKWTCAERVAIQAQWAEAEKERRIVEANAYAKARREVASILRDSVPASPAHPYLCAKGVKPLGGIREHGDWLILSLRDASGELHSLQQISAHGVKRFHRGGRIKGAFFAISDTSEGPLVVTEGYATGASVHEATGHAVVCAMNCGNLLDVAQSLRAKWRDREIIVAADDDRFTEGNPGLTKATDAARTIGARLAVPRFKDAASRSTDFNDLHQQEGINTVKTQIEAALQPTETDQESFDRLAKLTRADYDRCRDAEAKRLGIRTLTLDDEVCARRPKKPEGTPHGTAPFTKALEPWDEPVDGPKLLGDIEATLLQFCVLPPHAAPVLAVWLLQTYGYRLFDFVAVIALWSPEPECGKGRVLDVCEAVALNPFRTSNTSAAVLYHSVSKGDLTVLIDELDSQSELQREAIGNVLKSGFQSNGTSHRMAEKNGQQEVAVFPTFSPKMVATIGLDSLDKATRSRAIGIRMSRKPRSIKLAKFRRFDGTPLRRRCLRWVKDNTAALQAVGPIELNECATDRQEDVWEPLVAIARIAGGDWEERIREAACRLSGMADKAASESAGHQVLNALRDYFVAENVSKASTQSLLEHLNATGAFSDLNRGRGLTAHFVAKLLKPYGVSPRDLKLGDGKVLKGYDRGDFDEAFSIYLATEDDSKRNSATKADSIAQDDDLATATNPIGSVSENPIPTNKDGAGSGVAESKSLLAANAEEISYV